MAALASSAAAQDTAAYFRQNCASCHTIGGGRLTGPDLKDVGQRRTDDWLVGFITDPPGAMASGDAYALKLKDEARGVVMPVIPGLTKQQARELVELIARESALDKSQFVGMVISAEPFTAADVERGRQYVLGSRRLLNGGPACVGCHTVGQTSPLGGGRLGPDLTHVYQRLGADSPRRNLSAWLTAPATATMQPVFKRHPLSPEEIHALVALLEFSAREGREEDRSGSLAFLLLGCLLATGALFGMDAVWRGRFRGVRQALVLSGRRSEARPAVLQSGVAGESVECCDAIPAREGVGRCQAQPG